MLRHLKECYLTAKNLLLYGKKKRNLADKTKNKHDYNDYENNIFQVSPVQI